jgi:hypothetical protein
MKMCFWDAMKRVTQLNNFWQNVDNALSQPLNRDHVINVADKSV